MWDLLRRAASSAMVGREVELSALHAALRDCGDGRVRWVLVAGEAGVGKTRLLNEFLARLPSEVGAPAAVVGHCVELGASASGLIANEGVRPRPGVI
jgi:hypothetical protein